MTAKFECITSSGSHAKALSCICSSFQLTTCSMNCLLTQQSNSLFSLMFFRHRGRAEKQEIKFPPEDRIKRKILRRCVHDPKVTVCPAPSHGPRSLWSWPNLPRCLAVSSCSMGTLRKACRRDQMPFSKASIPSGQNPFYTPCREG